MPIQSYEATWNEYQQAIRTLYRRSETAGVERGMVGISEASEQQAAQVVTTSEQLRNVLSEAVETGDPNTRDLASLKLLAAATYDLSVAADLLEAEGIAPGGAERSAPAVFTAEDLRQVLEAPLDGTRMSQLPVERSTLPRDSKTARAKLSETVEQFITDIPDEAAGITQRAVGGALNFGLGPVQMVWSALTQEILPHVPDGVSFTVKHAAQLAQEAVRKLWAALGEEQQSAIQSQVQDWWTEVWEKPNFAASLLGPLYQLADIETEVTGLIQKAPEATEASRFNSVTRTLEELLARYSWIQKILEWVMRVLSWVQAALLAASPWGPLVAYASYAGIFGYAIYSGGDYLDSRRFEGCWLDHVLGLRGVMRNALA